MARRDIKMVKTEHKQCIKCLHHTNNDEYQKSMNIHNNIVANNSREIAAVDMISPINIKIAFHFMAKNGTYDQTRVTARAYDIVNSLNDDFNNYSPNMNTMNNSRYKNIIARVFRKNERKQRIYLSPDYLGQLPSAMSNITFEMGNVYYYRIDKNLDMGQLKDMTDMSEKMDLIRKYIYKKKAVAITPMLFMNIWVIDMANTDVMGYSSFPWELPEEYHGLVVNRRVFFPEDYSNIPFNFHTITHHVGHYLGLPHTASISDTNENRGIMNFNQDMYQQDSNTQLTIYDNPLDFAKYDKLHYEDSYNPLFMNFMDYTVDEYCCMFTANQIRNMRFMIFKFRSQINSLKHNITMHPSTYNPDTDSMVGARSRRYKQVRPTENVKNPRILAQGYIPEPQYNNPNIDAPNISYNNNPVEPGNADEQIYANIRAHMPLDYSYNPNQQSFGGAPPSNVNPIINDYNSQMPNYQSPAMQANYRNARDNSMDPRSGIVSNNFLRQKITDAAVNQGRMEIPTRNDNRGLEKTFTRVKPSN
jgi:hypothetical protein